MHGRLKREAAKPGAITMAGPTNLVVLGCDTLDYVRVKLRVVDTSCHICN